MLPEFPSEGIKRGENKVYISAATGSGIDLFLRSLEEIMSCGKRKVTLRFDYSEQGKLSALHTEGKVEEVRYEGDGIYVTAVLDGKGYGKYAAYIQQ